MYLDRMKKHRAFMETIMPDKMKMVPVIVPDTIDSGQIPPANIMILPSCGTAACQAGWCFIANAPDDLFLKYTQHGVDDVELTTWVRNYLGLSARENVALINLNWPRHLSNDLPLDGSLEIRRKFDLLPASKRKRLMLAVLDHIIEHGFDWLSRASRSEITNADDSMEVLNVHN